MVVLNFVVGSLNSMSHLLCEEEGNQEAQGQDAWRAGGVVLPSFNLIDRVRYPIIAA
jgi:hypothetical protein